jgi:hypothetical protein
MELQPASYVQRAVLAGLLAAASPLVAGPPSRLHADIQSRQTFLLKGNIHPMLASAEDQGEVPGTLPLPRITMHFQMTAAQQADLDQLLKAQQDPSSPQYHQWLTPELYAERFGISAADLARITAWLEHMGFTDVHAARSRTFVTMSGTAAQVRYAFQSSIHRYRVNGSPHYANATGPALPIELQGMVAGIRGLNDFRPRAHVRPKPRYTSNLTGNHFMAPGDFATIYDLGPLYSSGIDGTGQSIAVTGQTDIALSDIEAFQSASGLPVKDPQIILYGYDPGTSSGDVLESSLDLEWSGAVARGADIIYVNSSDVFDSTVYAIDNNLAPVVSLTYGACEAQTDSAIITSMNSAFAQANTQGITVVVASGDQGAADCDDSTVYYATQGLAVDFPASSQYVTGMGGTEFNEGSGNYWSSTNAAVGAGSALSYIPEIVWNDTVEDGSLSASGGGASILFPKPSWQKGTGVPADSARDVPDLALDASVDHDGYLICDSGWCTSGFRNGVGGDLDVVGGTSAGAPTFAGIAALLNQKTGSRQGNINPVLYTLAATSTDAFHDITVGNNIVPCETGSPNCTTGTMGFSAGPGYDQTTGLGTVDAYHLVTELAAATATPTPTPAPTPTPVPAAPVLSSPANGATGIVYSPALVWQASSGATSYNVYFGTTSIPPMVASTTGTSYATGTLAAGVTYYWMVAAVNAAGSANSATWSFTTLSSGSGPTALFFVPVTPCRVADTRNPSGAFGGPTMTGGSTRSFAIPQSACGIPATAQAYSLNVTVVPQGALYYLSLWPAGVTQPVVSTLNSYSGDVIANAAIVPAGAGGAVSVYVTNDTDVVLDIDGYFSNSAAGAAFSAVTLCRVADTRNATGSLGGPAMSAGQTRDFPVLSSSCEIPSTASAYSMNVTVVPGGALYYLSTWPSGEAQPLVSTLNSYNGAVLANAAIVPAGSGGSISVYVTNPTNVILDANGYFAAAGSAGALSFYPVTPCRVADTRNADGPFGGPVLADGETRSFAIAASGCNVPTTAQAYSLNATVVPAGPLYYLSLWPAGATQPGVSTLNSYDGSVIANAAIVPAGAGGAVDVYVTNSSHVILDINGYFAP